MKDEEIIGRSWEIPAPTHVGHTLTVKRRADEEGWPGAFLVACSCGKAQTIIGEAHIGRFLEERSFPYRATDAGFEAPILMGRRG